MSEEERVAEDGGSWSGTKGMEKEADIEENNGISLFVYASGMSDSTFSTLFTPEQYVRNSDKTSLYNYCGVVTCMFMK